MSRARAAKLLEQLNSRSSPGQRLFATAGMDQGRGKAVLHDGPKPWRNLTVVCTKPLEQLDRLFRSSHQGEVLRSTAGCVKPQFGLEVILREKSRIKFLGAFAISALATITQCPCKSLEQRVGLSSAKRLQNLLEEADRRLGVAVRPKALPEFEGGRQVAGRLGSDPVPML